MFIGNKNKNVIITANGITIKNGLIQSANYKAGNYGSMLDLTNGTFDYAGGRLTYQNNTLTVNGNITADKLIATRNGKIANFNISEDKLSTDNVDFGDPQGIYFGKKGISIGNNFKAGSDGSVFFKGDIEATSMYDHKGTTIPVILAKRDGTQTFTPIWSVILQINNDSYIELKDSSASDYNKTEIEIKADKIRFAGDTYSNTGEIMTSDYNAKSDIKPLTEKFILFFSLLQPVSFTFKDGTSGRTHVGFISQDVENAMQKTGLTSLDFAGFCKDVKTFETMDEFGNKTCQIENDEHGNTKYIYSLRYDEFIPLNTFMIQNLYRENQDIKERLVRLKEKVENLHI